MRVSIHPLELLLAALGITSYASSFVSVTILPFEK